MIRQIVLQQHKTILTRSLLTRSAAVQPSSVLFVSNRYKGSIVDSAKETLSALNKKIGQAAAAGLEKAEDATESIKETDVTGKAKESLDAVNKKVGQAAAAGIEKAEEVSHNIKDSELADKAKAGADQVSKKTSQAADATEQGAKETLDSAKGAYNDAKDAAKEGYAENVEGVSKEELESKVKETYNKAKDAAKEFANVNDDLKNFGSSTATEEELLRTEPPKEGTEHVKNAHKGYKSLQHKGKQAYTEQNRPEDFM